MHVRGGQGGLEGGDSTRMVWNVFDCAHTNALPIVPPSCVKCVSLFSPVPTHN